MVVGYAEEAAHLEVVRLRGAVAGLLVALAQRVAEPVLAQHGARIAAGELRPRRRSTVVGAGGQPLRQHLEAGLAAGFAAQAGRAELGADASRRRP